MLSMCHAKAHYSLSSSSGLKAFSLVRVNEVLDSMTLKHLLISIHHRKAFLTNEKSLQL